MQEAVQTASRVRYESSYNVLPLFHFTYWNYCHYISSNLKYAITIFFITSLLHKFQTVHWLIGIFHFYCHHHQFYITTLRHTLKCSTSVSSWVGHLWQCTGSNTCQFNDGLKCQSTTTFTAKMNGVSIKLGTKSFNITERMYEWYQLSNINCLKFVWRLKIFTQSKMHKAVYIKASKSLSNCSISKSLAIALAIAQKINITFGLTF